VKTNPHGLLDFKHGLPDFKHGLLDFKHGLLDCKSFWEFFREINLVISAWKNWPKDSHSLLVLMPWKIVKPSLDCIKKESWWQSIHWKIQLIQLVPHQTWRFWKFWLNSVTNCWNKTRKWSWIIWTKKCQELHHLGNFFFSLLT